MLLTLPYRPRKWQHTCHRRLRRFNVLALHRRAGKSRFAVSELSDQAIKCRREGGVFGYIAPFRNQAKTLVWAMLKLHLAPLITRGAVEILEAELTVRFAHNGAEIRLFGADNADAIRGVGFEGVVLDETAQIDPEVWTSIVRPALSDRLGWAIFIGTPRGVDLFYEPHHGHLDDPDWYVAVWTVYETNALDAAEVEAAKADMSEEEFAREYLCDFNAGGPSQLISMTDVELAASRSYVPGQFLGARVLGVDVARFGDDRSVIFPRQGLQAYAPIVLRGLDNMAVADRVAAKIREWQPRAVFIDAGAGAGVIDRLRQLGHEVTEVNFGSRAIHDDRFVNRRTEMWWGMREWVLAGGAIPKLRLLKQELATPTYEFDTKNRYKLESKDDIKERLLNHSSPDLADGLALTFAAEVREPDPIEEAREESRRRRNQGSVDYDPTAM